MRTAATVVRMECASVRFCEPLQCCAVDSATSLCSVAKTLRHGAVESVVCRRSGSLIAPSRVPCARQKTGAR
eukprot:357706-Lingulodinium_polyedra.AAC.1